jgi:hypothetical protein
MTDIHPSLKDALVFGPEVTHAMGVAFDEVCRALFVPANAKSVRKAIAEKIIEHARHGECDADRLRDAVLRQIGASQRITSHAVIERSA